MKVPLECVDNTVLIILHCLTTLLLAFMRSIQSGWSLSNTLYTALSCTLLSAITYKHLFAVKHRFDSYPKLLSVWWSCFPEVLPFSDCTEWKKLQFQTKHTSSCLSISFSKVLIIALWIKHYAVVKLDGVQKCLCIMTSHLPTLLPGGFPDGAFGHTVMHLATQSCMQVIAVPLWKSAASLVLVQHQSSSLNSNSKADIQSDWQKFIWQH